MPQDAELDAFKTEINLSEYAASRGYHLIRHETSRNSVAMKHPATGDKIIIARNEANQHWIFFTIGKTAESGTIIDFVQSKESHSLGGVRKALRPWIHGTASNRPAPEAYVPKVEASTKDRQAIISQLVTMQLAEDHAYLASRAITKELLTDPRFAGRVYTDSFGGAVFPHEDGQGICGLEQRNHKFKGFPPGSDKALWRSNITNTDTRLVFTESAIDALSYHALHPADESLVFAWIAMPSALITVDPRILTPHPQNAVIYGEEDHLELLEQIQSSGWIKPVVVTRSHRIISGHRRWNAAIRLQLDAIPIEYRQFESETAELEALLLENATRSKTVEQKVREAEAWREIEQAKARVRQAAGLKHGAEFPVRENFPQREEQGRIRDIIAQRVGFGSGRTYEKASQVVRLIDQERAAGYAEHAQTLQRVLNGQSVDAAARLMDKPEMERRAILDCLARGDARDVQEAETRFARHSQRLALADIAARSHPLPDGLGTFNVILADPPWPYHSRAHHQTRFRGGAAGHYPLMSMDAIRELGASVQKLAAEDAVLYLWCTGPLLEEQISVFEAWGFEYVTLGFVWVKLNPKNQRPFHGVGFYTKSNAELCLFGRRGKTLRPVTDQVSQIIYPDQEEAIASPALLSERREHSRKPDALYEAIEAMYPGLPKLELFARTPRKGWRQWGNQALPAA